MRRYHPVLTNAAIRVSQKWGQGTASEVDDLVQEIYLRFCSNRAHILTSFRDPRDEAIFGYLKVAATNIAHDVYRHRTAAKRGGLNIASLDEIAEPTEVSADPIRNLTLAEIDLRLMQHTQSPQGSRDRAIFRFYFQHGMTAQAISELAGVGLSSKGVEGVLFRLTKLIRKSLNPAQEIEAE